MSRPAYQQRVIDEKAGLDARLARLNAFIVTETCIALPFDERCRLAQQAMLMAQLSKLLGERIAAFASPGA